MRRILFILSIFIYSLSFSQSFVSSNLPIISITTDINADNGQPYEILDESRCTATIKIIQRPNNQRNYVSDENTPAYINYSGKINIEIRGSTSQYTDKKPYGFTTLLPDNITKTNVSLLDMPKENDWILSALVFDPSLIRDCLIFEISRQTGNYAPRCKYCELLVNGDYRGLYMLVEKIKIDDNRVNIGKISSDDITVPNVTGGYLIKSDKTTGGDPVAWNMSSYAGGTDFIYENPSPYDITSEQSQYISNQLYSLQDAMDYGYYDIEDGYPSIIDIPTFIDFMLLNEIASNVDGYQYSTYYHKNKNGKLRAGPLWDFNLSFGNDLFFWGLDRSFTNVWQFYNYDNTGPKYWKDLYDEPTFKCYLTKRWKELNTSGNPLHYNSICNVIDSLVTLISEASTREETKWGTVGNLNSTIITMKSWLNNRISWLNSQLSNYSNCANPYIPKLVITKINYYPFVSTNDLSKNLEFIEITNSGNNLEILSGIYFKNLGVTYSFPNYSTLSPHSSIFLASNATEFENYYGFAPFGEYTRNLSNKTEKLTLCDAYGNIIDEVQYLDTLPWPVNANGKGEYLQLTNINLDNSLASSWKSTSLPISGIINPTKQISYLQISKNQDYLEIKSKAIVTSYTICDITGRIVLSNTYNNSNNIDITNLSKGVYIINYAFDNNNHISGKFLKNK